MANTKVTQHVIADDAITTAMITDGNVTVAKLPSTVDLSSKTLTLPAVTIPSASTATTQSQSDGSTKVATTAYVDTAITNLIDSAPGTLNTLNELAAALNDDANFNTTISNSVAAKLPLAGGTMTGDLILGDNIKLEVGSASGGDLQIYHDTNHSYIDEQGTGGLILRTGDFYLRNPSNADMIYATSGGAVKLYHNNTSMLETSAYGVDAKGTGALKLPVGTTGQRPTAATGQIRWNSTDGALEVYNGSAWTAVGTGSSNKVLDTFTGDGSTTDFTLSVTPANEDALMVFIDGVYQEKGDYVLTNAVLALDTAPASGEKIACHITTASVHDGTSALNQQFTATSGQTAFTLSQDPGSENNTQVYINGVYQQKTDYTVSGTTLTFDTGLTVGDVVEVNMFTVATLGNTDTVSEGSSNLYHTTARARSAISVSGNALSYNSSTGVITSSYEESPTFTGDVQVSGNIGIGANASNVIGVYSTKSHANGLAAELTNSESSTGSGLVVKGGNNASTYSADFRDYNSNSLMRIRGDGNVGIGTTNPSEKLHIGGTAPGDSIIRQDATSSGTNWEIGERVAGKYQFWEDDGDNVRLTIMSTGNVGIGTDNPSERLEVDGVVEINRTGDHPAIRFSESDTVRGYIGSGDWAINGGADDDFGISASSSGDLLLGTTAGVEKLRITSNLIQLNGGNQSYSNNQRVLSKSENISWSSSTSAQSWTSSNYLPYQKFVEAALHFGYVGNGAISQHFYLSLLNNFTGLSIQTIQSSSGNSGSSYHTISFTSTGAYNSRRIVVQNTPAGGQNTANLNGTIYYGFAR